MKKFFIILSAILVSSSLFADDLDNELTISGGWPTPVSIFTSNFANRMIDKRMSEIAGKVMVENPATYGAYSLSFHHRTSSKFRIGFKLNWEYTGFDLYTTDDPELRLALGGEHKLLGRSATQMLTAMLSMQFITLDRDLIRLYSGIDLGGGCAIWKRSDMYSEPIINPLKREDLERLKQIQEKYKDGVEAHFLPAFNITLIGLQVGNRVYGLAEINAGTDAIVKLGLGARF